MVICTPPINILSINLQLSKFSLSLLVYIFFPRPFIGHKLSLHKFPFIAIKVWRPCIAKVVLICICTWTFAVTSWIIIGSRYFIDSQIFKNKFNNFLERNLPLKRATRGVIADPDVCLVRARQDHNIGNTKIFHHWLSFLLCLEIIGKMILSSMCK